MALSDIFSNLQILVRWLHVLLGILWLGSLFFFDFVVAPSYFPADARGGDDAGLPLVLRALNWMRWAALFAVISGATLLVVTYFYVPGKGLEPSEMFLDGRSISARAVWIFFGMALAVVMFFNVWMVAEPALKKLLLGKARPDEITRLRRQGLRAVRAATVLSGPMLFGMLAPAHYGAINLPTVMAAVVLGSLILWCIARI
jgi:uncharacterized membrane protein